MKKFGERNGQCNMKKYFNITKIVHTHKGHFVQMVKYENPVELIIDPKNKTFRVDNSWEFNLRDDEITFITEDNSIIKYSYNKLTIVSEKILR